jgi:phosphoglycerate dehydrogenase-like enzyme
MKETLPPTSGQRGAPRIAFIGALASSFAGPVRMHLGVPCEIVLTDETDAASVLPDVEVLVTLVFTAAMGAAATRLRLVQVPGAGLDRIDRKALPPGAVLANVYGHETGIAEYVLGAMLALTRSFRRVDAALRTGRWESQWAPGPPPPVWPELAGKTVGILGYGRIGHAVARRAQAFDMAVCAIRSDGRPSDEQGLALLGGPDALDDVLQRADYLIVTLPLTPATRGLIGGRELRLMKPHAYLINVARAEIIEEEALYRALADRTIAGAALDVWYRYPTAPGPTLPARLPFHELPNVLMTPHVSGWTDGMLQTRAKLIAENVRRVMAGESPMNRIP